MRLLFPRFAIAVTLGAAGLACSSSHPVSGVGGSSGAGGASAGMGGAGLGGTAAGGGAGATGTGGDVGGNAGTNAGGAGNGGAGASGAIAGMGDGGAGIGGGTVGGAGGGNVGGAGGMPMLILPDCVTNLLASCEPRGACTTSSGAEGTAICFASGVRATSSKVSLALACGGSADVTVVTKADGSPCYSLEVYGDSNMACEGAQYIWKDAAGQQVATGLNNPYDNPETSVRCTAGGTSTCANPELLSSNPCCAITKLGTSWCMDPVACTAGSCP